MARFQHKAQTGDKSPEDYTKKNSSGGYSFAPLKQGNYTAIIKKVEDDVYKGKDNYFLKITPTVVVLSDDDTRTLVNRQDLIVSAISENGSQLIRTDGDTTKDPVFRTPTGAFFLLKEAGCYSVNDGGEAVLDFDMELIFNRVMSVQVGLAAYIKGGQTWDAGMRYRDDRPACFGDWVAEHVDYVGDKPELDEILAAVDAYNEEMGYEEGEGIRLKNVIVGWYSLSRSKAEFLGYHYDEETQLTFVSEADYDLYVATSAMEIGDESDFEAL